MVLDVLTEERGVGKRELVANLFNTKVGLTQVVADILQHLLCNPFVGCLAGAFLADGREVFGRDTEFAGVGFYRTALYFTGMQ